MARAVTDTQAGGTMRVRYDGDQRLLAFAGAVSFVVGSLFWALAGVRSVLETPGPRVSVGGATTVVCFALALAGVLLTLVAWGLLSKMQRGDPLAPGDLTKLLVGGLIVGVILGFLVYAALHFKLEDPEFYHLASQPENIPPATR